MFVIHTLNPVLKHALVGMATAGLLAGCGALPDKPARAALYDFGPGAAHSVQTLAPAPGGVPRALPMIALAEVEANSRLDGTQLLYRLAYADVNELRPYGRSRWSQPPAQLLRQRLREALAVGHTVLGPDESASMGRTEGRLPDTLRLTLEEFSQYFESPRQSVGLVRVSATLIRSQPGGDKLLAQRSFTVRKPALTPDGPGGVKALAAASDEVVVQIVTWVDASR